MRLIILYIGLFSMDEIHKKVRHRRYKKDTQARRVSNYNDIVQEMDKTQ